MRTDYIIEIVSTAFRAHTFFDPSHLPGLSPLENPSMAQDTTPPQGLQLFGASQFVRGGHDRNFLVVGWQNWITATAST